MSIRINFLTFKCAINYHEKSHLKIYIPLLSMA
nr:MAG TPA: hypothetical protein [Caudoviricetes sp.]